MVKLHDLTELMKAPSILVRHAILNQKTAFLVDVVHWTCKDFVNRAVADKNPQARDADKV